MKKFTILLSLVFTLTTLFSQDLIVKKDASEIKAKVIEILPDQIKYKKFELLSGPLYNIPINEVFMVIYKNGDREVYHKGGEKKFINKKLPQKTQTQTQKQNNSKILKEEPEFNEPFIQIGLSGGYQTSQDFKSGAKDAFVTSTVGHPFFGVPVMLNIAKFWTLHSGLYYYKIGSNFDKEAEYLNEENFGYENMRAEGNVTHMFSYLVIPFKSSLRIHFTKTVEFNIGMCMSWGKGIGAKVTHDWSRWEVDSQGNQISSTIETFNQEVDLEYGDPTIDNPDELFYDYLEYKIMPSRFSFSFEAGLRIKKIMISATIWALTTETKLHYLDQDVSSSNRQLRIGLSYFFN